MVSSKPLLTGGRIIFLNMATDSFVNKTISGKGNVLVNFFCIFFYPCKMFSRSLFSLTGALVPAMFSSDNKEISKSIRDKLYKSVVVLTTRPFSIGSLISIEGYSGKVENINLMYVKLRSYKRSIYIPTSFIYDKIITETE